MRSAIKVLWRVFAFLGAMGPSGWAQQGDIRWVHDPSIIKEKDAYYLFSSGEGLPIRRSTDLVNWQAAGSVFPATPNWISQEIPNITHLWAPDIARVNGQFILTYAASTMGSQRSIIAMATNETLDPSSPAYRWVDRGKVIESFPGLCDFNAIDSNLVLDDLGQPWLCWGSFWGGIKLARLDPDTLLPLGGSSDIHALAFRPERMAVEAAFLIKRAGVYYLFVSFDQCCRGDRSTYKIMVGRSDAVTGPYVDRQGRPMMEGAATLVLKSYGAIRGPGHNAILQEGDKDYLVHHYYDQDEGGVPKLQIRPILWDEEGWPLAGEPLGSAEPASEEVTGPEGDWRYRVDDQPEDVITLRSNHKIRGKGLRGQWSQDGSALILQWRSRSDKDHAGVDRCVLADDFASFAGRTAEDGMVRGVRVSEGP